MRRVAILVVLALLAPPVAAGLLPTPATDVAASQDALFRVINGIALIIGVVVELLLVWLLVKFYRNRDIPRDESGFRGHTKAEIAWTFAPVVVLVFIAYQSVVVMEQTDRSREDVLALDPEAIEIGVVGHQFLWEFHYPQGDPQFNELRVEAGRTYILNVTSADVGHAFNIPEFGIMVDAWPTRNPTVWFEAPAFKTVDDTRGDYIEKSDPNEYFIQCREYCGAGHSGMHAKVVVFAPGSQALPYGPASVGVDVCTTPLEGRQEVPVVLRESGGTGTKPWSIDPATLTLPAGARVRFVASAEGSSPHNLHLGAPFNAETPNFTAPVEKCLDVQLPASGTVEYWCAVPGHRGLGMEGVLTIQ